MKVDKKKKLIKHVATYRYFSGNTAVAKVNKKGKITATGVGETTIYIYSNNGTVKKIKVTVEK